MILSSEDLELLVNKFNTDTDDEKIARWIAEELEKEQAKLIANAKRGKTEGTIACPICVTKEILEPFFPGCVITPHSNIGRTNVENMFFKVQW
jgi:hypothetical protein